MTERASNRHRLTFERSKEFGRRLEKLVPGGAHTYSKGRDQFPEDAPNGIVRGKGCWIWDQDGNRLVDWGMGLTSVSLGHAYDAVDDAVCEAVRRGVNFPRPAQLELEAAETLLAAVGIDGMVKFAKHGSTVTTAAVKLARAFTGKSIVACPIEQPFFSFDDWFIGSTPVDFGVPDALRRYTVRFRYGDLADLHRVFRENAGDVACVMMELVKFEDPPAGYLEEVQSMCHRNGALLVVDEMVSGAKWSLAGAQGYFGHYGDLSTWGKGIANGYACTCLVGRPDVMALGGLDRIGMRKLFLISTTHGAESSGLAAMIATMNALKRENAIVRQWEIGADLRSRLQDVIDDKGLSAAIRLVGHDCLIALESLDRNGRYDPHLRTLWMQEMMSRGVCTQGLFMPTISHDAEAIEMTVVAFTESCEVYAKALHFGSTDGMLVGPEIRPVFRRTV